MTRIKGHCFTVEGSSDKVSFHTLYVYPTYNVHVVIYCTLDSTVNIVKISILDSIRKGIILLCKVVVGGFGNMTELNTCR
jgi:hypothetical protein